MSSIAAASPCGVRSMSKPPALAIGWLTDRLRDRQNLELWLGALAVAERQGAQLRCVVKRKLCAMFRADAENLPGVRADVIEVAFQRRIHAAQTAHDIFRPIHIFDAALP